MEFTFAFLKLFLLGIWLVWPLLVFFCLLIILLGQWVGKIEKWTAFDAFYWSFITACTVGFGDIHPEKKLAKMLAIIITFTGIMFTGILVAIAVTATTETFQQHTSYAFTAR